MGSKRKIITINQNKCTGCGLCIPNCPEGAIQIIDEKARLISDLFCDGLGACIGHCPEGAITIEEREAEPYDERKVMENIIKQGDNVIKAHLAHLMSHGAKEYLQTALDVLDEKGIEVSFGGGSPCSHGHGGCPGSATRDMRQEETPGPGGRGVSRLRNWPIQITLANPNAPYFKDADLVVAADCTAFAYANLHEDFLKGKIALIGCPKLDDADAHEKKLTQIFSANAVRSITCLHMEVPCCFGLVELVQQAIQASGKKIPFEDVTVSIKGDAL